MEILVQKVSPATSKTVNEQNVPFQELTLKDKTGKATVAIWEDMVFPIDADLNDVSSDEETEEDQASELIWPAGNIIGIPKNND
ncbi:hypothetical protein KUTeg_017072 [Tegillarca granosa]|uniref:Uncharacterized protein n=1 Tax=Tegillarca granosa TaxID=220873 RepID=A0ABQ9ERF6_TEGGR|nr:hypothetical protein KUTeg_017072 [Tegillarca granosa]